MDVTSRIERALNDAIGRAEVPGCPPRLAAAMRYAVFPRRRAGAAPALSQRRGGLRRGPSGRDGGRGGCA